MITNRSQKLREAQEALEQEQYEAVVETLAPLWEQAPYDREVFYLLNECYQHLEKWADSEQLIRQLDQAYGEEQHELWISFYLARKDVHEALKSLADWMASNTDFYEEISRWGYGFKNAGFEAEYLAQLEAYNTPDALLALVNYDVQVNNDYPKAIDRLKTALQNGLEDERIPGHLAYYQTALISQKRQEARKVLSGENKGNAVPLFREVLTLEPQNVTAQEYYLSALACRKFPPFYIYFHQNNFVSTSPYFFRGILLLIFCLICTLYYKSGKPIDSPDQLRSVVWFFAALAIPRYTLFPLSVQLLSFWYVPGYHLLKKPYDFLKGLILLLSWIALLYISLDPAAKGFHYFICGCFAFTYLALLEFTQKNTSPIQRKLLNIYTLTAFVLGVLAYLKILPDGYLFWSFAGWLPPLLAGVALDFYQKMKAPIAETGNGEATRDELAITRRIHWIALVIGILLAVLFLGKQKIMPGSSLSLQFLLFGSCLLAITLFAFTEASPAIHCFSLVWKNKARFRWLFLLGSTGMIGGLLALAPYGDIPLRSTLNWIPGLAAFLGGWAGLFVLYYRFLKKN